MTMSGSDLIKILENVSLRLIERADYLSELDGVTGDGEHGINMEKGFRELLNILPSLESSPPGEILKQAGKVVMTKTGGSAGILYGTMFLEMSRTAGDADGISPSMAAEMFHRALEGVMKRGGAKVGDKTLIDAMSPAVEALAAAASDGADLAVCFKAAAEAAQKGMESTRDLAAKKGRSSYQGENSRGALDPGAVSMCYIFEQFAAGLAQAAG